MLRAGSGARRHPHRPPVVLRREVARLGSPVDRIPPLVRSAAIPAALPPTELPGFLRGGLPPGPAAGEHVAFLVLTAPGAAADGRIDAGEVRALATARFTVTP